MFHNAPPDLQDQDQYQYHSVQDLDQYFFFFFFGGGEVSDWSSPKTDGLRPHHWSRVRVALRHIVTICCFGLRNTLTYLLTYLLTYFLTYLRSDGGTYRLTVRMGGCVLTGVCLIVNILRHQRPWLVVGW